MYVRGYLQGSENGRVATIEMMPPYKDAITSWPDLTISSWDALGFMKIIACSLRWISFRILKCGWSIPNIGEVVSQPEIAWTNGIIWHESSPSVDVIPRISYIFIVVELVLIDLKYISFESRSKWKRKSINKSDLIWFLVFNATFSNISAISWRPVLVVEEARVPGENHRPWASNG